MAPADMWGGTDDDMMPPLDDINEEASDGSLDISLPDMDEEKKEPEEEKQKEETDPNAEPSEKKEEPKEESPEEKKPDGESEKKDEQKEDDLNLEEIFKDLDWLNTEQEDLIKKAEDNWGQLSPQEIADLKRNNEIMQKHIEKLSGDKADLMFKNAELQAFGGEFATPELLILSRNLPNVDKDERSKTKVVTLLKNMYEDLTGKDINQDKVDKETDVLAASEAYNSSINPDLKTKKDDDLTIVLD